MVVSEAAAIEQARAIAEVQAAVTVALSNPRDEDRAVENMRRALSTPKAADRAFYAVKNRGSGPSVHLARELARVWGNIDYGVRELRRDDDAGESEIQAFAWDQQTNVRSTRSFIVPHQRMAKGHRKQLVDLQDVYLNNQNIGARAVRECIFTVLPTWFTEEAQDVARATLEGRNVPDAKPVAERAAAAIERFAAEHVTQDQLERYVGAPVAKWTAVNLADLTTVYTTIKRDRVSASEFFEPATIEAAALVSPDPAA